MLAPLMGQNLGNLANAVYKFPIKSTRKIQWKLVCQCDSTDHPCKSDFYVDRGYHLSFQRGSLFHSRIREMHSTKNGRTGEKMKLSLCEFRFLKRRCRQATTPVPHVRYQILLVGFLRNRLLRLLSRTIARRVGIPSVRSIRVCR